jgi:hypothetical protein
MYTLHIQFYIFQKYAIVLYAIVDSLGYRNPKGFADQ